MAKGLPADDVTRIAADITPARTDLSPASARLAYLSARQFLIHAGGNERIESVAPYLGRLHTRALAAVSSRRRSSAGIISVVRCERIRCWI
jgi:hypothetical protein